jgi:hypothetical protein
MKQTAPTVSCHQALKKSFSRLLLSCNAVCLVTKIHIQKMESLLSWGFQGTSFAIHSEYDPVIRIVITSARCARSASACKKVSDDCCVCPVPEKACTRVHGMLGSLMCELVSALIRLKATKAKDKTRSCAFVTCGHGPHHHKQYAAARMQTNLQNQSEETKASVMRLCIN